MRSAGTKHLYDRAKLAEYERLVGKLYAENAFLKKVLLRLEEDAAERKKQDHVRGCM